MRTFTSIHYAKCYFWGIALSCFLIYSSWTTEASTQFEYKWVLIAAVCTWCLIHTFVLLPTAVYTIRWLQSVHRGDYEDEKILTFTAGTYFEAGAAREDRFNQVIKDSIYAPLIHLILITGISLPLFIIGWIRIAVLKRTRG